MLPGGKLLVIESGSVESPRLPSGIAAAGEVVGNLRALTHGEASERITLLVRRDLIGSILDIAEARRALGRE